MSAAFTVAEPTPPDAPTTATKSSHLPSEGTTVFSEGAVATSNSLSFETIGLKSAGDKVFDARGWGFLQRASYEVKKPVSRRPDSAGTFVSLFFCFDFLRISHANSRMMRNVNFSSTDFSPLEKLQTSL